jgi:SSS family solute:Na+ symporter
VGGLKTIRETIGREMLRLNNASWSTLVNWFVTILPIWFIGMTLYQRIYAARDAKTARKAWFIAGFFEYPVMAFTGVFLGLMSRVAMDTGIFGPEGIHPGDQLDPELGLPLLIKTILPVGLTGLVLSAYFSAIMSTADSCLIAASGNLLTDVLRLRNSRSIVRISQMLTLVIGAFALVMALKMPSVLELMLYSYSFMVSGLIVPVLAGLFTPYRDSRAAFWSMIIGGASTLILILTGVDLPFGLDANIFGITLSALTYAGFSAVSTRVLQDR